MHVSLKTIGHRTLRARGRALLLCFFSQITSSYSTRRSGSTLLELVLFLGLVGIMSGTVIAVFMATQDARVRQQGIAALEQRGGQVLQTMTRRIRRGERILYPAVNTSAPILVVQMTQNSEFPTIFAQSQDNNIVFVEKNAQSSILSDRLTISNLSFRNIDNMSIIFSFDLSIILQLPSKITYSRHFESAVTLFPQDRPFDVSAPCDTCSGGCGTCPVPTCSSGTFQWSYCDTSVVPSQCRSTSAAGNISC